MSIVSMFLGQDDNSSTFPFKHFMLFTMHGLGVKLKAMIHHLTPMHLVT